MRNLQFPRVQKITLFGKIIDIDQLRSLALSSAASYRSASSANAQMLLEGRADRIFDDTPLYTECVAGNVAGKHIDPSRTATMSSIYH